MWTRLALIGALAVVGCKDKQNVAAEGPAAAAPVDPAAASAAAAALALARAASAAANGAGPSPAATAAVASATASASASASASAAVASGFTPAVANELGRLGFSTAAKDLLALGRDRSALLLGFGKLAKHPASLAAIFNSDKVVTPFMKRADVQEFCRDPERLKQVLRFVLAQPAARVWVSSPESIRALTGSKLGTQFQACPAFKTLAAQPRALANLTRDDAAARAVVSDPSFRAELERLKIKQDLKPDRVFQKGR